MRILMCCADWGVPLGGNGGSSVHLRAMSRALAGLGHEVRLVVSNAAGPTLPDLPVETVPYRRLWPATHGLVERLRGRDPVAACSRAGGASAALSQTGLAQDRAQPVNGVADASSLKVRLYYRHLPGLLDSVEELACHRLHFEQAVRRVVRDFRPHGVYERYALGQTGTARAVRRLGPGGPPHLLEVNASLAVERALRGDLPGPLAWLARLEEARLWRRADRIFCVSTALRDTIVRSGAAADRVEVAQNGVDLSAFTPDCPRGGLRRRLGVAGTDILVGFVGSLSPGRGAAEFLRILALVVPRAPGTRGVVVGDGPLAGELRRLATRLGLDGQVTFLGSVAHGSVPGLLVDLDIALACYPRQEGFYFSPLKVLEYMASGVPVVCGRAGQMRELVEDGVSGVLVEPGDLAAWAEAVADLCRRPERRTALGRAARKKALAGPTWENNAARVTTALEILTRRNRRVTL